MDERLSAKERRVALDVGAMLRRHVVIEIDRSDRTLRLARATVDALVRIDIHLDLGEPFASLGWRDGAQLIEWYWPDDAVAGAHVDTACIAGADALLSDHVCHAVSEEHSACPN